MSFLNDQVLPALDAADAGLLSALNPKKRTRYWVLDCPSCQTAGAAYYYPGHSRFQCSRKNNCGHSTSLWEYVLAGHGGNKQETFNTLCAAAGVVPPARDGEVSESQRLSAVVRSVLKSALINNTSAGDYLATTRKHPRDTWDRLDIGYYPGAKWLEATLKQRGVDLALAREWDILPDPKYRESLHANRLVGWWKQPNGTLRLWSRLIGDPPDGPDAPPKYRYGEGMVRTIPYGFRRPGHNTLICVEGPLDRHALEALGIPANATGGNAVIDAQAAYMAANGVEALVYFIDADKAGTDGALATIRNCEPRGITCFFATPPAGLDVDDLYQAGEGATIVSLLETAVSSGALLAREILAAGDDRKSFESARTYWKLRGTLTPYSWDVFTRVMQAAGRPVMPLPSEALQMMARLLEDGVRVDDAQTLIQRRYGLQIAITEAR
ncbi:hypothetical protein E4T66_18420 [Sinimarinibacterium sp. CAU 1509]|uniref:toprim domain-containing protein n=1 Tax=Sinimarinibacterium sp. CAU 1509 TaxID=2562283 RepID=UPI0010AC6343|nr:toprim domain-containing protein [Sinimarinibacterium sp. CAU 1509]TJY57382.1 hypothetical protein E4T66_18420 [Sinimarinibacterium sp. CAU 1509]